MFWFNVLTRWIHISSAVVGVGALVFMWLALLPAAEEAGSEAGSRLIERVLPRARRLVHVALGLLLLTGAYNFYVVIPKVRLLGDYRGTYHALIGIKILLALILFAVATMLLSRPPARRSPWLVISVLLAAVILLLSATLRRSWDLALPSPEPTASRTHPEGASTRSSLAPEQRGAQTGGVPRSRGVFCPLTTRSPRLPALSDPSDPSDPSEALHA